MAFFKFRKPGDESAASSRQPESIEAMRRRARHRLIGAAVLVLAGVIGFPQLFDTQPRPVSVDIPIEIPDRNKVKPLAPRAEAQGAVSAAPSASAAGPVTVAPPAEPAPAVAVRPEEKPAAVPVPAAPAVAKVEPPAKPEPEPKPEAKDSGAKARALLEGKPAAPVAATAADGRFVVQVGAFADPGKARETRQRVERAGLKTYTHVAETKDGKRTRVRVGPFASRAEADKAAEKIKGLDLPAAILTL